MFPMMAVPQPQTHPSARTADICMLTTLFFCRRASSRLKLYRPTDRTRIAEWKAAMPVASKAEALPEPQAAARVCTPSKFGFCCGRCFVADPVRLRARLQQSQHGAAVREAHAMLGEVEMACCGHQKSATMETMGRESGAWMLVACVQNSPPRKFP